MGVATKRRDLSVETGKIHRLSYHRDGVLYRRGEIHREARGLEVRREHRGRDSVGDSRLHVGDRLGNDGMTFGLSYLIVCGVALLICVAVIWLDR